MANGSTIESGIAIDPAADKTTILEQIATFYGQRQTVVDAKLAKIAKRKCAQNKKILDIMRAVEVECISK